MPTIDMIFSRMEALGGVAHSGQNSCHHEFLAEVGIDHQIVEMGVPPFLAKIHLYIAGALLIHEVAAGASAYRKT